MRHTTNDIGEKANHIAKTEADKIWREKFNLDGWFETYHRIYFSVLAEFQTGEGDMEETQTLEKFVWTGQTEDPNLGRITPYRAATVAQMIREQIRRKVEEE